jgi:uncharacterized membrane protein YphA (DoxX/SURF4 family)
VYRRLRRSFGRQPLRPRRMVLRMVLLGVIAVLLAPMALRSGAFATAAACGLAAGVLVAMFGASRTRFENIGAQRYYVPHTYTGIAVSLLFVGRVAYRVLQAYGMAHSAIGPGMTPGPAGYVSSPLTLGLFYVLAGYYIYYLGFILWKSKHLKPGEAQEVASPPGTGDGRAYTGRADSGTPT